MGSIEIRPAGDDDGGSVADVYLASFHAAYDFPLAHSDEEVRDWVRSRLLSTRESRSQSPPAG